MEPGQSPVTRLNAIVEQGLCIGCGLCQSVAGPDKVRVVKTTRGFLQPVATDDLGHDAVDRIYDTCPGTRVDGLPRHLIDGATKTDNVWGPWRRMVRAWAADPDVRFEGSTGGVLTALGSYLLSSKRVDFILHTRSSTSEPAFGERHLSFNSADVIDAAGSRYGPTATLIDVDTILDRNQPFAFIGKPCDISALRNYARHDARVNKLVKYWLTLVCGGFGLPEFTEAFCQRNGIEPETVTALRYRGRGCPGPTRVEWKGGAAEYHYLDYWGEDESQWKLPFRCKVCADGIGEGADLAAADTWPGGSPDRIGSETDPGVNAIIARTATGQELMEAAARDGALRIEYDITPDDMSIYQPHQMRKKYAVWARHQGMGDEGRIVPDTNGLRIRELADELPRETNEFQRQGTRKRIRNGKATEPEPKPY